MKQKILLFTENFPPIEGGSGRWFWELYSRLDPQSVVIVTHNEEGSKAIDKQLKSVVVRMPLQSPEWGLRSITGLKFYWRCVRQLQRLVKQYEISEVHCGRVIHEGVTAWLATLFGGKPYRCFIHGEDVETAATSKEQSLLVKQVCKHAKGLICNSNNSAELATNLGFAESQKCTVLHPGADFERFVPQPADVMFKQKMGWHGKYVLLTVGRLQQRKGQDKLIESLTHIINGLPNILYVVIGSGDCKVQLEALVDTHGLQEHVQFLSGLNDQTLIQCYQQCDLFILPNRTIGNDIEGFGMVLVEAQACGKPVVAGDSGGTKETMLVGETGFIIDCTEPTLLAKQLLPILQAGTKPAEFYREFAQKQFSWETHTKKFIEMINRP